YLINNKYCPNYCSMREIVKFSRTYHRKPR
ncbi:hypothetical protein CP8484711_0164B, partial [Chlamydia psittaci 84-8471/1]